MNDRIELRGIEVMARHGVLPQEKDEPQRFVIDLEVYLDLSVAGISDDLADTVDYGRLAQEAHDLVGDESHQLIEVVAERLAGRILATPRVERVVVTIHKPQAPIAVPFGDVAVTVDRSR